MAFPLTASEVVGSENGFNVLLFATGPLPDGDLVHAITVTQQFHSWNVLRRYDEFMAVDDSLAVVLSSLPPCPAAVKYDGGIDSIVKARNTLQDWLKQVLRSQGACESLVMINFLTYGANMIPPKFEHISWTFFAASPNVSAHVETHHGGNDTNLDNMEMADMFDDDDDALEGDYDDDVADFGSATIRYKATDQRITAEDERDLTSEVEMVDDLGSLAQSLGASQLGKSLRLQAEIAARNQPSSTTTVENQAVGVRLNFPAPRLKEGEKGELSNVMEKYTEQLNVEGIGDSFYQQRPVSAPKLDSFTCLKVIGKGTFGKVFLIQEKSTMQKFALKVLKKDHIINRNQVEHTKTERKVLGKVEHPFIVGLNMAFQSKEKLYFVLDYCAGGELFYHLTEPFPEPRARFYAAEIILAISHVHELGIIHRDLKPENVLLDAKGHVRLTDFGLSKEGVYSSSSDATSYCGTLNYLAPEILDQQGHGQAADWWSLGALLYEMLTGALPFKGHDGATMSASIRTSELRFPSSLSRHAKMLLCGLLTPDPKKRLGSGETRAGEIKSHAFFEGMQWDSLERGEIPPPWRPTINEIWNTSLFDPQFTNMSISSPQPFNRSHGACSGTTPVDNTFEGFTFVGRTLMGPGA